MNSSVTIKEIEFIILKLPKQKFPGLASFPGGLYQTFKEEFISVVYNLF